MRSSSIRRFGDSSAPLWHISVAVKLAAIVVVLFAVVTVVAMTWRAIEFQEARQTFIAVVALSMTFLVSVATCVFLTIFFRPIATGLRELKRRYPNLVVLGGRLPRLADGVIKNAWPWRDAVVPKTQNIVLAVDSTRVLIFGARKPRELLAEVPWSNIIGVVRAEFVEPPLAEWVGPTRAYEGIAIVGPSEERAIVFQPVIVLLPIVRTPSGKKLEDLVLKINAMGSNTQAQSDLG